MESQRTGDLYALVCAIVCGLGNIFAKAGLETLSTEIFNFYFFLFASLTISFSVFKKSERHEILRTEPKILGLIFILAILFACAIYFFLMGLKLIEPATVAFLSRVEVIIVVILAYIFLKERLRFLEIVGGLIALGGVLILKYETTLAISRAATLLIISAFFFGMAEILVKKNINRLGVIRFIFYRSWFTVLFLYIFILIKGQTLFIPPVKTMIMIFAAAMLLPVLGRATYLQALKRVNISRAMLITQSTPLFTALFAFLILKSLPTPTEWLGSGLIITGVAVVTLTIRKNRNRIKLN